MEKFNNNKRIATNTILMSIRMVIVLCVTLYSSRVLLDALGVVDYGVYNVVAGFSTMFSFFNTSLSNGIQRFYNFEFGRNGVLGAKKVFNAAVLIQFALCILIILPTELFGVWYLNTKMVIPVERLVAANWIFQLALLTLLLNILQVPFIASVMANERMGFYAIISVCNAVFTLLGIFSLSFFNLDNLILYGCLLAIVALFSLIAYILYARTHFQEIRFSRNVPPKLLKDMLCFSGWNIFGTLSNMIKEQGTDLILNLIYGPILNAARGIANQVNGGLQSFVQNVTIPARPQVTQSYAQGNIHRTLTLTYTISKVSCYMLLMLGLPIMFEINTVLKIWLGNNIPSYTNSFVILIVLSSFLANLNAAVSGIVHSSGIMRNYQLSGGLINILSIILVYIAIRVSDKTPEIIFVVLLIMDIVRQIVAISILRNILNIQSFLYEYWSKVIWPIICVSTLSVFVVYFVHNFVVEGVARLILVSLVSIISVCIFSYFVGSTDVEKNLVFQLLKSITSKFKFR